MHKHIIQELVKRLCNEKETYRACQLHIVMQYICIVPDGLRLRTPKAKIIIEKSRGEVSLMGQDTIENVSLPIKNLKCFFKVP